MFARTERLLLRPGFPEDAPALFAAIADEQILRHLATAPAPYRMRDATAFLATPRDPVLPALLLLVGQLGPESSPPPHDTPRVEPHPADVGRSWAI